MKTSKSTLLDAASVVAVLASAVAAAGSQARWCMANQVSTAYLNDVLKGRREPGKKILDILGLEGVIYYRKKAD